MMNKNEAVQKLSKVARISVAYAEDLYDSFFEKPVVPKYVADWYEEHRDRLDYDLWEYLVDWSYQKPSDFKDWMARDGKAEPVVTLVNMHQFGYEVKEETKYRIKMKAARYNGFPQFLCEEDRGIFWGSVFDCRKTKFTRKELEDANFGWVFDCEGVEVKEVTDE
ncbi:DUF1642 domain-containing protein [Streptococcus salivarius]|uniref:DUF1642 domain-containing protein n=1 Tax=Streptococcus salivarius TaxID=1304 RepID=UPI00321AAE0B